MRELKFRAFDLKTKEVKQVDNIYFYNQEDENGNLGEVSLVGEKVTKYYGNGVLKQVEIMQYTGLKDKNGKEIYEQDIVKTQEGLNGEVVINGGFLTLKYKDRNYFDLMQESSEIEITGNIYENPDLLNK